MKYWNQPPAAVPQGYGPQGHAQHPLFDPQRKYVPPPPPPRRRRRWPFVLLGLGRVSRILGVGCGRHRRCMIAMT